MSTRIFLSYARDDDEPFVQRLYDGLRSAGFDVWFDRVSMPSRQLTLHQEIRDAIASRDRLVLVVGPEAVKSECVNQEWRFAYFEAVKCVNPIIRLNGKDAAGNTIDAYNLIPEDLRLIHAEDFRKDEDFAQHLENLIRQLSDPLPPAGKLVAVPELPAHYMAQRDCVDQLRDILLADLRKPVVVTGAAGRVGLHGMGGIGKSVLACALAHHPEIQRAFSAGVYWVTLGQRPKLDDQQRWLANELGGKSEFVGVEAGKEALRGLLKERAALVVLDDVWQRDHAEAFNVVGPRGRLLLTTRDVGLVTALAARENHYQVQLPTEPEARFMLAKAAGIAAEALPPFAQEVIAECGRLPLALALCGGMVRGAESSPGIPWLDLLDALREHDLEFLSTSHPGEEQHASVWKAINMSLRGLPEEQRTRFAELSVFGLDTGAPEAAVVTLWEHTAGLRPRESRKLLAEFIARSLVQQPTAGRMILHDLLHHFGTGMALKQFGSSQMLHRHLIEAYRGRCAAGWPSGPNDGYFLEHLCQHLIEADEVEDAVSLLDGLDWMEAKCRAGLAFGLQEDYRRVIAALPEAQEELKEEERRKARTTQWIRTLIECADQKRLPTKEEIPQSVAPWTDEKIAAECKRITENPTRLDRLQAFARFVEQELYPLAEFGARPGFVVQQAFNSAPAGPVHDAGSRRIDAVDGPKLLRRWSLDAVYEPKPLLLRKLEIQSNKVSSISVTPDHRRAVTAMDGDHTLLVWDLESGVCLRPLIGHENRVLSVNVTPDGRWAVSGSYDRTVRLWDLESGECLQTLRGHTKRVQSVALTPDRRRAVSGSQDHTLRVWELESGTCLRILQGHWMGVESIGITPDGRRVVSGSGDLTVRVWDLESDSRPIVLVGHLRLISSVSVTSDGRQAVSGSHEGELRVWDLESRICSHILKGHGSLGHVLALSTTPDGTLGISGSGPQGVLRLWDLKSGICLQTFASGSHSVSGVALTVDGRRAVSTALYDGTLRFWDLASGTRHGATDSHPVRVTSVCATPDGRRAITGGYDGTLRVWDLATGRTLHNLEPCWSGLNRVQITRDGTRTAFLDNTQRLQVWDLESGTCLQTMDAHLAGDILSFAVTPDGLREVTGDTHGVIKVWDLETGSCLRTVEQDMAVFGLSITLDAKLGWFQGKSGSFQLWDLELGTRLLTNPGFPLDASTENFFSLDNDATLRVWDLKTGSCLNRSTGYKDDCAVSFTPDWKLAIRANSNGSLRVCELESGIIVAIARPTWPCTDVAVAGSRCVVAGTTDGEVLFFDIHGLAL